MEWTAAQPVFITHAASDCPDISLALSARATKGWGWSGADATGGDAPLGKQLMIVPTDGAWHWPWNASTPALLWRNSSNSHSYHVILMLTEESSHQTTQSPWHPSWLIIIQSGKWDWWLRGHWIRLQLRTWMATDSLTTMASVCKPGYYRCHIYCWTISILVYCYVLSKIILIIVIIIC